MEDFERIVSLRNINASKIFKDILLLLVSGTITLLASPSISTSIPEKFYFFNLTLIKNPTSGISALIWIFSTFILFLLLKHILRWFDHLELRENEWSYAPPLTLDDIIFQGWSEIRKNDEIFLTNSGSGLLFKKPWLKNFEINFKFNFEKLETSFIQGIFDGELKRKLHKFNFLGLLFRAQSLEDYFMLSIGIQVNEDDYEEATNKQQFEALITPHIKLNGNWEHLGGRPLGTKLKVGGFNSVKCSVNDSRATIEINNKTLTWNLPTNFEKLNKKESYDPTKIPDTKSSEITFRNSKGMLGFRAYYAERAVIKDIKIKKL